MQVLITTGTLLGTAPIYLPYGVAPVPFGDPLAATLTYATPTVVTVPGYNPNQGRNNPGLFLVLFAVPEGNLIGRS